MYPAKFDYHRASSVEHVFALLDAHVDAKVIAGGHSLVPMMKMRLAQPEVVIDIARVDELRGIRDLGSSVRLGALTTHAELARSAVVQEHCALLPQAAAAIGDVQVRNRGTLGGNIAHADPGSDLPAALMAVRAQVEVRSASSTRTVDAADFFVDLLTTDLSERELVTAIMVPHLVDAGCCYAKFEHPASGYAVAGAAAWLRLQGNTCVAGGLAVNGATVTPYDGSAAIDALVGSEPTDAAIASAVETVQPDDPMEDVFASGDYRSHLARVYSRRALIAARDRAAYAD